MTKYLAIALATLLSTSALAADIEAARKLPYTITVYEDARTVRYTCGALYILTGVAFDQNLFAQRCTVSLVYAPAVDQWPESPIRMRLQFLRTAYPDIDSRCHLIAHQRYSTYGTDETLIDCVTRP